MLRPAVRGLVKLANATWMAVLTGAAFACATSLALAAPDPNFTTCTKKPKDADTAAAKSAHKVGEEFFERGEYARAIQLWKDAYNFDCSRPAILLNIGNAQEKSGDRLTAVDTYDAYLQRVPSDNVTADKVKVLKASLSAQTTTTATTTTATTTSTDSGTNSKPTTPDEAPSGPRPYGSTPIVVAATGGALVLTGGLLTMVGRSKVSSASDACPNRTCTDATAADDGNTGRKLVNAGVPMTVLGAVALGGGLVWQLTANGPAKQTGRGFTVLPAIGSQGGSISLFGAF